MTNDNLYKKEKTKKYQQEYNKMGRTECDGQVKKKNSNFTLQFIQLITKVDYVR